MPGFFVHRGNRLERLADALAEVVRVPVAGPFARETIVVPSKGLERWVAMQLASRLGSWANGHFPFPRAFVDGALRDALGRDDAARAPLSPDELPWAIAARVPGLLADPAFGELRGYLAGDRDGARLLSLSSRIARVLDQYPVYRPELVRSWERGDEASWQAVLWRAISPEGGATHVARRVEELKRALASGRALGTLPPRACIFGIPSLPPIYLDVLAALSSRIELHAFIVSPSREHWSEIRSRREIARALAGTDRDEDELLLTEGNPLLASLGRVGRDGQFLLESRLDYAEGADRYAAPAGTSALAVLQDDVLALRHRRAGNEEAPPLVLAPHDRSITIHACHGPMREIEVLRDVVLSLLDEDPSLAPEDIVVMAPDIETYAPFVEAVFAVEPSDPAFVPFRVADRAVRRTSEVVDALLAWLEVAEGRFGASEVLDLLGHAAVRERFGLNEPDVERLRAWVQEAGIRWGADAEHRGDVGQPRLAETTWAFGLDRLLLGFAMPGDDTTMFGGALPYDDVEGSQAALVGKLADLIDALTSARSLVSGVRTVPAWRDALSALLARGVDDGGPRAVEHEAVREALSAIATAAERGGFETTTPLAPIVESLERTLGDRAAPHGFLSGGITFCALLPLRSIPFRVVCLVGMNDDAFPRAARPPSFDLVAAHPRRGDRSVRDDDRYLFLEAILSARERLVITHVGQSAKDGSPLPPSVVVGELLDVMTESFRVPEGDGDNAVRSRLVLRHPMQPFSPRYFRDGGEGGLFSYARPHERGAAAMSGERVRRPAFFAHTLQPGPAETSVDLDELSRFFAAPLRGLLMSRLSLSLGDDAIELDDREPVVVDGLARFALGSDLANASLEGRDIPSMMPIARAAGRLPLGTPGERAFDDVAREALAFAERVRPKLEGGRLPPLRIDLELGAVRVTGLLRDLYPLAQVHFRFARLSGKGLIRTWIHHLALLASRRPTDPDTSVMVPRKGDPVVFGPVDDPRGELARLVAVYVRGQHEPLPFFPDSSLAYVTARADGKAADEALWDARKAFAPSEHQGGHEGEDAYVRRALASRDPFMGEFRLVPEGPTTEGLAEEVLGAMVRARRAS